MEGTEKIAVSADKSAISLDRRISVAPMMDYTDRHCRYFLRLLSPSALLYTEMITAAAIVRGDAARLLEFHPAEHPVALQLGGSNPRELARAARIGAEFGYDEINLNCGCPSDRVQSGRFGACLMAEPSLVGECVSAMRAAVDVPVTVKCRIGIEPMPHTATDAYEFLVRFVDAVARAGCTVFVVHARQAVLNGLSPKENREIPPLQYDVVRQLRADFPALTFVVNGGVRTLEDALEHLRLFDGVMIGREAYQNPYLLALLHRAVVDPSGRCRRARRSSSVTSRTCRIAWRKVIVCERWCVTCKACTPACRMCARGAGSSQRVPQHRTRAPNCSSTLCVSFELRRKATPAQPAPAVPPLAT